MNSSFPFDNLKFGFGNVLVLDMGFTLNLEYFFSWDCGGSLKKNPKRNKKENDSNSSRESLEMEIRSYKQNKKISQKKTGEGEEIKFFLGDSSLIFSRQ